MVFYKSSDFLYIWNKINLIWVFVWNLQALQALQSEI